MIGGCGESESDSTTLTLDLRGITSVTRDAPPKGSSAGDARSFSGALVTTDGKPAGRLHGANTLTYKDAANGKPTEYRLATVEFTLNDGSVLVSGIYPTRPGELVPNKDIKRAIVGGTGKYEGAGGQVSQTAKGGVVRSVLEIETPND